MVRTMPLAIYLPGLALSGALFAHHGFWVPLTHMDPHSCPAQNVQLHGTSTSLQPLPFLNFHPRAEFFLSFFYSIQPFLQQNPLPRLCHLDTRPSPADPHAALPRLLPCAFFPVSV